MAATVVEKLGPTQAKITITVTPDELKPHVTAAYEEVSKHINVPGFRKGKVPAPIIDQRVGRAAVLQQAVNESLDSFYRAALTEENVRPLGNPEVAIDTWPNENDFTGDLIVSITVDVRPDLDIPSLDGVSVTVDSFAVTDDDLNEELDRLRWRFGTLVPVDRPAKRGDSIVMDLVARVDGKEVDSASDISYELGSGELLEGTDEALETLSAGENAIYESTLVGGDYEGQKAEISATVTAVKERELPTADDEFAQLASEYDTLDELKASLENLVGTRKQQDQTRQAHEKLIEHLLDAVEVPVPDALIEGELERRRDDRELSDDEQAAMRDEVVRSFQTQLLLDEFAAKQGIEVTRDDFQRFILHGARQYGTDPGQFVQRLTESNQMPQVASDIARNKALSVAVGMITVVDTDGKTIDLSPQSNDVSTGDEASSTANSGS